MKKVLIITYYWPPSAGAGVFRWLKFTRYLRNYGWEPVIYTPENPESPATDHSLELEVPGDITIVKRPIREPYRYYKILTGKSQNEKIQTGFLSEDKEPGMADKFSTWVRGNFFIPDARKFWIKPSIRFLTQWLQQNHVDAMVSTGPPHSMHMIALGLKNRLNIPWLADFRDPWTQIDFYDKLMLTRWAHRKHLKQEKMVLTQADAVVCVSKSWTRDLEKLAERKVEIITNGYDEKDFDVLPEYEHGDFSITHLGAMNADRNPVVFWKALAAIIKEQPDLKTKLKIQLIGKTDYSVKQSLQQHHLHNYAILVPHMPHYEALKKAANSALLLLPLNKTANVKGILPGKIYEYLALKRPILCTGPVDGDASDILQETKSGVCIYFDDFATCKKVLLDFMQKHKNKKLFPETSNINRYSRSALTKQIANIMNSISENPK